MKLRNKKTGEIGYLICGKASGNYIVTNDDWQTCGEYNSIKEFTDHWEDAPEEPKKHYEILGIGVVIEQEDAEDEIFRNQNQREIGNYFESEEEAELAVRKLKAWKRLEDKGFRFVGWQDSVSVNNPDMILFKLNEDAWENDTCNDLDLLFGGEE